MPIPSSPASDRPASGDWPAYWWELRNLIDDPANGLLLDAETDYDADGNRVKTPGVLFRLASGGYRQYFVSLWELYDNPVAFMRCMDAFADKAIALGRELNFDTIVTCTQTAREFVHHIRARVEKELRKPLKVIVFGHYPWASVAEMNARDFDSRKVLIVTDVIATGRLVRDMAARVIHTRGEVKGVLCVVLTKEELCSQTVPGGATPFDLKHGFPDVPTHTHIYALTARPVTESKSPGARLRQIDFVSVFPEMTPPTSDGPAPLILTPTMYEHFERAEALSFGFFQSEKHWFTLSVCVERLLDKCGDAIWSQLSPILPSEAIVVSTFKKDELRFADFVRLRLKPESEKESRFVLKRELGDSPHLHRALYRHAGELINRDVILVRASATTSEELRSLAALLASQPIKSLHVVCLVNHMGHYTDNFVRRVKKLVCGLLASRDGRVKFDFHALYNLIDVRADDLARMHERARGVLQKFKDETDLDYFKPFAEKCQRFMEARATDTALCAESYSGAAADRVDLGSRVISLGEAIAAATHETVCSGEREKLKRLASVAQSPAAICHVLGLALADVDYLRVIGALPAFASTFRKSLADLRDARFLIEELADNPKANTEEENALRGKILGKIQTEIRLLFAWGMLSHFDQPSESAKDLLSEILFAGKSVAVWKKHPRNLRYHFREVDLYGMAIFVLHAASAERVRLRSGSGTGRELISEVREQFEQLLSFGGPAEMGLSSEDEAQTLRLQIRQMLDLLLTEFGGHAHKQIHERLRYLQRYVLRDKLRHNPLITSIDALIGDFEKWIIRSEKVHRADIERHYREATLATLNMLEICGVAKRFSRYSLTPIANPLRDVFERGANGELAKRHVENIQRWLEEHQELIPPLSADVEELRNRWAAVRKDLFDHNSKLFNVLLDFIVDLEAVLLDALERSQQNLKNFDLHGIWARDIARLKLLSPIRENRPFVLVDPILLREALVNVLDNVRHNILPLPIDKRAECIGMATVKIDLRQQGPNTDGHEVFQYHVLTVESPGISYETSRRESNAIGPTIESHRERIASFYGTLDIANRPDETGSRAVIRLLDRDKYALANFAEIEQRKQRSV